MEKLIDRKIQNLSERSRFAFYFRAFYVVLLVIGILFIGTNNSTAQKLTVYPAKPTPGDTLRFTYEAGGGKLEKAEGVGGTAFIYVDDMQVRKPISLKKMNTQYVGEIVSDSTSQFLVIAFSANKTWDNLPYEQCFIPFYKNGNPVSGALSAMADWYVNSQATNMFHAKPNYKKAKELYEKELENFPLSPSSVTRNYFENYYKSDSAAARSAVLNRIQQLNTDGKKVDVTYFLISKLYDIIGMTREANETIDQLTIAYPNSPVIFGKRFKDAIVPQSARKMELLAEKLIKDYNMVEGTDLFRFVTNLNYSIGEAYIREYNLPKYFNYILKEKSSLVRAESLVSNARYLLEQNKELAAVERIGQWTLRLLDTLSANKNSTAALKRINELSFDCTEILGKLYYQQKRFQEAYVTFNDAYKEGEPNSEQLSLYFGLVLTKLKKYEYASRLLERAIRSGANENHVINAYKEAFSHSRTEDLTKHLSLLLQESENIRKETIKKQMMNKPAPGFSLLDNYGKQVNLSDFKGKIVVLDFWATWCIPCLQAFPGMQQTLNKYKNDSNIVFLFINTAENFTKDRVKNINNYLKQNKFSFQVLFDEKSAVTANRYRLQTEYDASSIPLKIIIDKQGNMRFRSVGYPGSDEQVVKQLSEYIEAVKTL